MGRYALTVFIFLLHLRLSLSQLPSDQVSTMNTLYEIFQNNTGSSFVWANVQRRSNPCSWRGVTCNSDNSSIIQLSFASFQLSTSDFLPTICQIDTLGSLDVSNNMLASIPDSFFVDCGGISGLRLLNFSRNRLTGSLPTFNSFRALEVLDFARNSLSGEIVSQLEGLDSLRSLNLSWNRGLTGNVPTNLGPLGLLQELQLSANIFTNGIPPEIFTYRNLSVLDIGFNKLSGSIPDVIGQLPRLETLVLSGNHFTGGIPNSISNVSTLIRFGANQNSLNGTIPDGITSYVRNLDLSYNMLTGTIPNDLLSGPRLQYIDLSNNVLQGEIPATISTHLIRLRLGNNSLDGMLPAESFRNLTELTYLEMDNNNLTGPIPSELGMCQSLALLNLAGNGFTGSLPPVLGNLTNLQVLNLQANNITGVIPAEITRLDRLEGLNLSRNSFTGSIPSSISNLRSLANLDLQGNSLSGEIPNGISSLSSLRELQLANNQIGGPIPEMPSNLQIALNLSHNQFAGHIPVTLARLSALEVLDLSDNQFSGEIPSFVIELGSLTYLDLSNNQLSGVLPRFGSYVVVDTNGTSIVRPSNPAPAPQKKRRSVASSVIIGFTTASVVVILMLLVALFILRRYNRINDEILPSGEEGSPPRIIHGNLLTPNSIHRSNIDYTKAMEAVADPSNVISKTRFSTYYKSVMPSGASYFVKKLNWSDKLFQLGTQEKFGEELEVLGKLGNSNIMVPLAYVLTIDSAYLFYDYTPKGTLSDALHGGTVSTLAWASRYSIAIGVAQGLSFLHGCNSGPILLLDLSSKSILLKSSSEPQIGDIELGKVIDPLKSTGSISTVAGSAGYIPPEYAYTMRITAAGNVYSFGAVLLELLTGKPAVSGGTELAKWVSSNSVHQNKWDQILDFSVSKTSLAVRNQMLIVLKVALACVNVSPDARPKMKSVLRMLLNAR